MFEKIKYYSCDRQVEYTEIKDSYKVLKDNKIIRFIFKILLRFKIISGYSEEKVNYNAQEIDLEKVQRIIEHQYNQWIQSGKYPTLAILGRKQMHELRIDTNYIVHFNFEFPKYRGLTLMINPFIDGVVLA